MPDILNEDGLTIKSLAEIRGDLETGFRKAYGDDINLDANSPDGQVTGILAQVAYELRDLAVTINAYFDPDLAPGSVLDQRVAINKIARKGGTFTIVPVSVTVDRTVTLSGLDADYNDLDASGFTVQDDAGNQFILIDTTTLTTGTTILNFRAKDLGAVLTTVGTIVNQNTVVLGVTTINNASAVLEIGQDEETDAELRFRRQKSVANASSAYLNGLEGSLLELTGVSDAKVYENELSVVDENGQAPSSIWCIVEGGANDEIGFLIYSKKSPGANMVGAVAVKIARASGDIFTAKFDRPTARNLHLRFEIQKTDPDATFNLDGIKQDIAASLIYKIGEYAETATATAAAYSAIEALGGGGVPLNMELSKDNTEWVDFLNTITLGSQWTLSAANITITVL